MKHFEPLNPLATLAADLLPKMVDPAHGLVCHKRVVVPGGYENRGVSPLYTAMAIVGMVADRGVHGLALLPDPRRTLGSLRRAAVEAGDHVLLSAAAWALSLCGEDVSTELETLRAMSVRRASSMGLGLVLTAAAAAALASPDVAECAHATAAPARAELENRFSPLARLFRASGPSVSRGYVLYRGITSYASQVYPLHGIAEHVRAFGGQPPPWLGSVAAHLVDLQGPLGQWWWLYSERDGRVLEGYPVYSVHQDAMAFMALLPLQRLGVGAYDVPLARGLAWLGMANELGEPLVDGARFIYRAIQRRGGDPDRLWGIGRGDRRRTVAASRGLGQPPGTTADTASLEVLRECRPYHLGWILFARSLASSIDRES